MSFIDGLTTFQNQYFDQVQNQKAKNKSDKTDSKHDLNRTDQSDRANKSSKTDNPKQTQLSDKAKALLEELKAKYGDTDFFIAGYGSKGEADRYLSQGAKAFSVLIDPEDLEAMANDEDLKNQTLSLLDEARENLINSQNQMEENGDTKVKKMGVTISTDGTVSYFAELEKMSQKQKERIEKVKETKAEEKKKAREEETGTGKNHGKADKFHTNLPQIEKHTSVQADSIEELLEQIRNINWDEVDEEKKIPVGRRFDLSI